MTVLPEWITSAAIIGLCAIAWAEIRGLRASRHEYNNRLGAVEASATSTSNDVAEVKQIVGEVRDSLIAAGIIKPKGA